MPDDPKPKQTDKFRRYRVSRRAEGLKLVRIWLPDTQAPGFREEASRQAALLRGKPEQEDATGFIESAADLDDWNGSTR
jgi:hypothetical protein